MNKRATPTIKIVIPIPLITLATPNASDNHPTKIIGNIENMPVNALSAPYILPLNESGVFS